MSTRLERHMYLEDILEYIPQKDKRAAVSWCERNGVVIHTDGINKYVFYSDFVEAYNRPKPLHSAREWKPKSNGRYKPKSPQAKDLIKSLL